MIKSIFWMLVLFAGTPLFMFEIDFLGWMTWGMIAYGVVYLFMLVLFTCLASHRDHVVVTVAMVLLLYQFIIFSEYGASFGLIQTVLFLLLISTVILLTESIRQNIPLMFFSGGSSRGWLRLLGETLLTWIWIPIFLVPLSLWISSTFFEWVDHQFYTQLPISKYCQINDKEPFDCTYMKSVQSNLRGGRISSDKQLNQAVEQAFYKRQKNVLNTIQTTAPKKIVNIISEYNLSATGILLFNINVIEEIKRLKEEIANSNLKYLKYFDARAVNIQRQGIIHSKPLLEHQTRKTLKGNIAKKIAMYDSHDMNKSKKKKIAIYETLSNVNVKSNVIRQGTKDTNKLRANHSVETGVVLNKLLRHINVRFIKMKRMNSPLSTKVLLEIIFPSWNTMCLYGRTSTTVGDKQQLELPCNLFNQSNSKQNIIEYNLDKNIEQTFLSHIKPARARIEARFGLSAVNLKENGMDIRDIADDFAENVFTTIDFNIPKECPSPFTWKVSKLKKSIKCKAERWVKIPIDKLVNDGIRTAKSSFTTGANASIDNLEENAEESLVLMRSNAITQLDRLKQSTETQMASKVAWVQSAILFILMVSFLQIIIRSFFSILGTKLFDQQHGLTAKNLPSKYATLSDHPFKGSINCKTKVIIPIHFTEPMISKTPLNNQAFKRNMIPMQPTTAFLARLRNGWYVLLCKGSHDKGGGKPMTIHSQGGRELIECCLKEGDELVVDFSRVIAMSFNIKLRTRISLRLSTIIMGKSIFHCANCEKGDGLIIMEAREGRAEILGNDATAPMERMVTWSSNTLFQTSRSSSSAVYKDGYNLRPIAATKSFIVIADSMHPASLPLWVWVKRLIRMLMPI